MNERVWILNHYAGNTFFEKGGRHYWLAKYLKRSGYDPVVFACNAKHGIREQWIESDDLWIERQAEEIDVPFVFVKAPLYCGNGRDRIVNMISFCRNVKKAGKEYAKLHGKPDVIVASSVHPLTLIAGIRLAKHFGVRCISEIRDLWPESIFAYSQRTKKDTILGKLLYSGEKWIYTKSDAIVFTMAGGADYIVEHGWDKAHGGPIDLGKVFHINNGVDLEQFDYNRDHEHINDLELTNDQFFKVVYVGSIRQVNNLGRLLDVAKLVKNPRIEFIIWGDGDEKEKLLQRLQDESIGNVVFKGKVGKCYIPFIISNADVNLMHGSDNPILRYGLSANKLFEYFAAGKPILIDFSCKYNPADDYEIGIKPDSFDAAGIAKAIDGFAELRKDTLEKMGQNARKAAEQYDFSILTGTLAEIIQTMIG